MSTTPSPTKTPAQPPSTPSTQHTSPHKPPPDSDSIFRPCPLHHLNPSRNLCSKLGYHNNRGVRHHLLNYHAPRDKDSKNLNRETRERMGSERWEAVKRVGGLEAVNSGVEGYFRVVEAALGVGRGEGRATLERYGTLERCVVFEVESPEKELESPEKEGNAVRKEDAYDLRLCAEEEPKGQPSLYPCAVEEPKGQPPLPREVLLTPPRNDEPAQNDWQDLRGECLFGEDLLAQFLHDYDYQTPPPTGYEESRSEIPESGLGPLVNNPSQFPSTSIQELLLAEINKLSAADANASVAELRRKNHIAEISALAKQIADQKGAGQAKGLPDVVVRPRWLFQDALSELDSVVREMGSVEGPVSKEVMMGFRERVGQAYQQLWRCEWKTLDTQGLLGDANAGDENGNENWKEGGKSGEKSGEKGELKEKSANERSNKQTAKDQSGIERTTRSRNAKKKLESGRQVRRANTVD